MVRSRRECVQTIHMAKGATGMGAALDLLRRDENVIEIGYETFH